MKYANTITLLAAVTLLASSCRGKQPDGPGEGPEPEVQTTTLSLSSCFTPKTVLGELTDGGVYRVYWSDGDRICVNGKKSSTLYGLEEGISEAEFSVTDVNAPYSVVYPSIICTGMDSNGVASLNLPVAQAYKAGSFASGSAVLYGNSQETGFGLNNLCGVVRIPLLKDRYGDRITGLGISSLSTACPLAGEFKLDTADGTLTPVKGSGTIMLSLPAEGIVLKEGEPTYFYVAIPAGAYPDGFVITLSNSEGTMLCEWVADTAIEAGMIATLPEIGFKPDATKLIDSVDSWNEFATAINSGDSEQINRWVNPDTGVATLAADISYGGDLTQINSWGYTFNGNGHSIKRANATEALFLLIEPQGIVKNLVLGGTRVAQSANSDRGTGNLAAYNRGLIEGCTNQMNVELSGQNKNILLAGLVTDNAGIIKDSKNTGNIAISMEITENRTVYGGGLCCRAQRNLTENGVTQLHNGDFINCENSGDITIKRASNGSYSLTKLAIGGIVGFINQGKSDGEFTRFENCTNNGNITVWQDENHSFTNYAYAVGGILGRSCVNNENTDFYYKVGGATATAYDGYYVEMDNCRNNGGIDVSIFSAAGGAQMSGARQIYVGGIAGCFYSSYDDPSTIRNCSSSGSIRTGHLATADCTGGLVGGLGYTTLEDCSANVTMGVSKNSFALSGKYIGLSGGLVGYILRDAVIKNCDCNLIYDSAGAKSALGAGFVGAVAKHANIKNYVATEGVATLTLEGTNNFSGTLNGVAVSSSDTVWKGSLGNLTGGTVVIK